MARTRDVVRRVTATNSAHLLADGEAEHPIAGRDLPKPNVETTQTTPEWHRATAWELLGLGWQDLDLDARRLILDAMTALRADKTWRAERELVSTHWQKTGLVFTTGIGTALSPRNVGRSFEESIARAGVPRMRLHDLRHVNASLDLSTGTSVKAVAARLGRSDRAITLRTYAHVMPHEETAAAERLGALLSVESG